MRVCSCSSAGNYTDSSVGTFTRKSVQTFNNKVKKHSIFVYKTFCSLFLFLERFRLTQILFLNLKLDAFFHFVLCVFYTVVMTQEHYYNLSGRVFVGYVLHIILTILLIPGLFLARYGVIHENKQIMLSFFVTQIIMGLDFILIMVDSAGSWVFWMLAGNAKKK